MTDYVYRPPQGRPPSTPPGERIMEIMNGSDNKPYSKSAKWHATRASPEFSARLAVGVRAGNNKIRRRGRALATRLNNTETAGVWMVVDDYARQECISAQAARNRASRGGWKKERIGGTLCIVLIPNDHKGRANKPAASVVQPAAPVISPPPPLRWWERILLAFGWR